MEPVAPPVTDDLLRAAVRGTFDPLTLLGTAPAADRLVLLARNATEKQLDGKWLWTLTPRARRQALSRLPVGAAERRRFLAENQPDADDLFGQMLQASLGLKPPATRRSAARSQPTAESEQRRVAQDIATLQAVQALQEAGVKLPGANSSSRVLKLRRSITLATRRQAARDLLPEPFRGRGQERKFLIDFAARGALAVDAARARPFKTLWLTQPGKPVPQFPAACLGGIGGSGKSALLSEISKQLSKRHDITLIGFDFDQPKLRAGDPVALSLEFSRQLGMLEPTIEPRLVEKRDQLRSRTALTAGTGGALERSGSLLIDFFADHAGALANSRRLGLPLVLVMDTFEELLIAYAGQLEPLLKWLQFVQGNDGFHDIRLILSGRAVETLKQGENPRPEVMASVNLGDLGRQPGEAKLRDVFGRYKIRHLDLVPRAVATFGSNPLVLEIIARFCKGKRRPTIIKLIGSGEDGARDGLQGEAAQRFLYSRILERIGDKALRDVASPGLVLRRVTVQLVRNVLAGRCSLPATLTDQDARDLLNKLVNQIWLVDRVSLDEVTHRRDLRRLMLPQILRQPAAVEIARAAAVWYALHPEEANASFEALYYRGLAGDELPEAERSTLRQLANVLGADVDDLPTKLRARVKNAAGQRRLTEPEVAALPAQERAKIMAQRRRAQIAVGLESVVVADDKLDATATLKSGALKSGALESAAAGPETPESTDAESDVALESAIPAGTHQVGPLASPEIIEAQFNVGDFASVASQANRQFLAALDELGAARFKRKFELNHPVYLSALAACLGRRDNLGNELRRQVYQLSEMPERLDKLRRESSLLMRAAIDGEGDLPAIILAIRTAGFDPWQFIDGSVDKAPFPRPARTAAEYRMTMALRQPRGSPVEVKAATLPILDPSLAAELLQAQNRPLAEGALRLGIGAENEPLLNQLQQFSTKGSTETPNMIRLADLNRLDDAAQDASVIIAPPAEGLSVWPLVAVGRVPELYAPARSVLETCKPEAIAEIVDAVSSTPFWPVELGSQVFHSSTQLVGSLIEIADRCGRFEKLLESAEKVAPQIGELLQIYRAMVETWTTTPVHAGWQPR